MGQVRNTPASAGVTPEELEAQGLASEAKAKEEAEKAEVEAKVKEEAEKVEAEVKAQAEAKAKEEAEKAEAEAKDKEEAEKANEVEVIPSNVFVAADGTEVEFAVQHFIFGKRKYTVEEAVAEIPEALQELYERNSFIFKKA